MHRGLRGVLGKKIARLQIGLRGVREEDRGQKFGKKPLQIGLRGVLGKKIARLRLRGVGEEDRGLCLCGVGEEDRGQGFQLSNRQVIINKGIPHFCYIIVFNEASVYGLTLYCFYI